MLEPIYNHSFLELTSEEIMTKLWDDGWVPRDRWNMEYLAAMRIYARTCKPVKVTYEGIYWFTYYEVLGYAPIV